MVTFDEMVIRKLDEIAAAVKEVGAALNRVEGRGKGFLLKPFDKQIEERFRDSRREGREEEHLRQSSSLARATWVLAFATVGLVVATVVLAIVSLRGV